MARGFVGVVSAELMFPENASLKDKRMFLRSMRSRLTQRHGATFAEVGLMDTWQHAEIVFAIAASSVGSAEQRVDAALRYLSAQDWEVVRVETEMLEVDV